ncbi:hypothetical protein BH11PSE4_BH11PSE4_17850 [soil metagenome]
MIKMHGFWRSAASFRLRIAVNLKGLPCEEQIVDIDAGKQYAPAYKAMKPKSAVPSLIVDDGPPRSSIPRVPAFHGRRPVEAPAPQASKTPTGALFNRQPHPPFMDLKAYRQP